jgi:hypothetical protein
MNTQDLIDTLAKDLKPARREGLTVGLLLASLAALGLCILIVLLVQGVRPDFEQSGTAVALKAIFSAAVAAAVLPVAVRLARPGRKVGAWFIAAAVIAGACLAVSAFTLMTGSSGVAATANRGFPFAFAIIPALATPAGFVIFAWYRRYAPTRLVLAGAAVGALSGGLGAIAYALICPVDDMGFVSTWYGASIIVCTLVGALIGPRVLRW